MSKLSYKSLLIILFFILIGIIVLAKFVLPKNKVEASWWNDGWSYRKAVSITNSSGSDLTDFQVSISIGTSALIASGKMQSDCDDIRITDINGNLLPYWIEENNPGCNQITDTKIWVKASSIPTSESTVYLYYGNTSATAVQDGNNVFEFFDDFNDGTSGQQISTSKWPYQTTGWKYYTDGINKVARYEGGSTANIARIISNTQITSPFVYEGQMKSAAGSDAYLLSNIQSTNVTSDFSSWYLNGWGNSGSTAIIFKDSSQLRTSTSNVPTTYTNIKVTYANNIDTFFYGGGSTLTVTDSSYQSGYIGVGAWTALSPASYWNYIFVRKYASTDPTTNLQSEEAGGGPIAYWKFDEGVGTTAYDSTTNKNNGTLSGSTLPSWLNEDQCISGKCVSFNGTNNYLQLPTINNIKSISMWVYLSPKSDSSWYYLLDARNGSSNGWFAFQINTIMVGSDWNKMYVNGVSKAINISNIPLNQWVHLYIENINNFSDDINFMSRFSNSEFLAGKIDEVKFYSYARTAAQIKQDYNSRGSNKGTTANLGSADSGNNLTDGLVGYWKFDEGIGSSITDSSGNNITGTTVPAWSSGKYGVGISLNGTSDRIKMSNPNPIGTAENGFTLSAWIYQNGNQSGKQILYLDQIQLRPGYFFTNNGSFQQLSFTPPATNSWHHIVGTFDGQYMKVYIDGVYINQISVSGNINNAPDFRIGGRYDDAEDFNGKIDEVRIYNRALSPAEVTQLYEYAPNPVGYYDFNDGSGNTVTDKSGNNNNGTWSGTDSHWTQGKIGSAGNFNGTNNVILIPDTNNSLDLPYDFTISFWVNPTSSGTKELIAKPQGGNYEIWQSDTNLSIRINGSNPIINGNSIFTYGQWTYITIKYEKLTGLVTVYKNGVPFASGTNTNATSINDNSFQIGAYSNGSYPFLGKMDEIKIYNYARTQKQIIEDMNSAPAASAKSVLVYYKFDEGNGTTVYNSGNAGIGLTATFGSGSSAPTWSNEGKLGKSLSFNGSNKVTAKTISSNQFMDNADFTISSWVKPSVFNTYNTIVGQQSDTSMYFYIDSSGRIGLGMDDAKIVQPINKPLTLNTWNYISVTYKGSDLSHIATFYINGQSVGSVTVYDGNGSTPDSSLFIGYENRFFYSYTGLLDEVKIYNYTLTANEIKQDYNQNSAIQMGSTIQTIGGTTTSLEYCIPGDTSYCASPVAEWKIDEGAGTSIVDTSGNNNTGVFGTGSSAPTWTQGKIGGGLDFNGISSFIDIPDLTLSGPFTSSFWLYNKNNSDGRMWASGSGSRKFGQINNKFFVRIVSDSDNSINLPSQNNWHFITLSRNSDNKIDLYVDGVVSRLFSDISQSGDASFSLFGNANDGSIQYFQGKMDQIKIYNYARTPAQIAYDYNKGAPVGWWKFDECQGNIAYDWSGVGNTGNITIGPSDVQNSLGTCQIGTSASWTNGAVGKINSCLNLDGKDDRVIIGNPTNLQVEKGDFTVAAWLYATSFKGGMEAVTKSGNILNGTPTAGGWALGSSGDHNQRWLFRVSDSTNVLAKDAYENKTFSLNNWYHVVGIKKNNTIYLYVNGNLASSVDATGLTINSDKNLYIGGYTNNYWLWPGKIDDVRIYNYALTGEQVKQIYNGGAVSFN